MCTRERVVHQSKHSTMYRSNLIGNFTHGGANGLLLLLISTLRAEWNMVGFDEYQVSTWNNNQI